MLAEGVNEGSSSIEELLQRFPCDSRAQEFLHSCDPDSQLKVIQGFCPRAQEDADYSKKLTSFIQSVVQTGRKRSAGEMGLTSESAHEEGPAEDVMGTFKEMYPMDERAWEFLINSSGAVQKKVVEEFKPRSEGDSDYSAPITTFVKRMRTSVQAHPVAAYSQGPSELQMQEFAARFPMDERAWEFLSGVPGDVQERVITQFKPRSEGDSDYSAAVTSFVKLSKGFAGKDAGKGQGRMEVRGPTQSQLETFRQKYPCDDRAFEFLTGRPPHVQLACIQKFTPRDMQDVDFSRPLTAFLKFLADAPVQHAGNPIQSHGGGYSQGKGGIGKQSPGGGMHNHGGQPGGYSALNAFRARYPMDDRAFEFLQTSPQNVQELVVSDFKPRSAGDSDYSGAITSFTKNVRMRVQNGGGAAKGHGLSKGDAKGQGLFQGVAKGHGLPQGVAKGNGLPKGVAKGNGLSKGAAKGHGVSQQHMPAANIEVFAQQYPMDERAWEYLIGSSAEVQKRLLEGFRPKAEGEQDYSRLITSFIKSIRSSCFA